MQCVIVIALFATPARSFFSAHYTGTITKVLVLQCTQGIAFSGCKQRSYSDPDADFLKSPFFVGVAFSSQDIDNIMFRRHHLGIRDEMIIDPPPVEMVDSDKSCPWQRTWMEGLQQLHDRKIYVKSSETGDPEVQDKGGPSYFNGSAYVQKTGKRDDVTSFEDRYADHWYALPKGERATSILDWERRIFLQVAPTNKLTIVHIQDGIKSDTKVAPVWYRYFPEQEAEAQRRFEVLEPQHRKGHSGPKFTRSTESIDLQLLKGKDQWGVPTYSYRVSKQTTAGEAIVRDIIPAF